MEIIVPSSLGSTADREYKVLGQVAATLPYPLDHVILEIGSFLGKSTITMAQHARHKIVSIDPHSGPWAMPNGVNRRQKEGDTYDKFIHNLEAAKVRHKVEPIPGGAQCAGPYVFPSHSQPVVSSHGSCRPRCWPAT